MNKELYSKLLAAFLHQNSCADYSHAELVGATYVIDERCPQDIDRITKAILQIGGSKHEYLRYLCAIIEEAGALGIETTVKVSRAFVEMECYTVPYAHRLVADGNIENVEHFSRNNRKMRQRLSRYDSFQSAGDLISVQGAMLKATPAIITKKGSEFLDTKVENYITAVEADKRLCVACGRDYFDEIPYCDEVIDHSKMGYGDRWYSIEAYTKRLASLKEMK